MLPWMRYKMEEAIENTCGWMVLAVLIATPVLFFVIFLNLLEPFWPIFTLAFFIIVTRVGCRDRQGKTMAFGGLTIYCLSWPLSSEYSAVLGLAVCLTGLLTWFWAAHRSISLRLRCQVARGY